MPSPEDLKTPQSAQALEAATKAAQKEAEAKSLEADIAKYQALMDELDKRKDGSLSKDEVRDTRNSLNQAIAEKKRLSGEAGNLKATAEQLNAAAINTDRITRENFERGRIKSLCSIAEDVSTTYTPIADVIRQLDLGFEYIGVRANPSDPSKFEETKVGAEFSDKKKAEQEIRAARVKGVVAKMDYLNIRNDIDLRDRLKNLKLFEDELTNTEYDQIRGEVLAIGSRMVRSEFEKRLGTIPFSETIVIDATNYLKDNEDIINDETRKDLRAQIEAANARLGKEASDGENQKRTDEKNKLLRSANFRNTDRFVAARNAIRAQEASSYFSPAEVSELTKEVTAILDRVEQETVRAILAKNPATAADLEIAIKAEIGNQTGGGGDSELETRIRSNKAIVDRFTALGTTENSNKETAFRAEITARTRATREDPGLAGLTADRFTAAANDVRLNTVISEPTRVTMLKEIETARTAALKMSAEMVNEAIAKTPNATEAQIIKFVEDEAARHSQGDANYLASLRTQFANVINAEVNSQREVEKTALIESFRQRANTPTVDRFVKVRADIRQAVVDGKLTNQEANQLQNEINKVIENVRNQVVQAVIATTSLTNVAALDARIDAEIQNQTGTGGDAELNTAVRASADIKTLRTQIENNQGTAEQKKFIADINREIRVTRDASPLPAFVGNRFVTAERAVTVSTVIDQTNKDNLLAQIKTARENAIKLSTQVVQEALDNGGTDRTALIRTEAFRHAPGDTSFEASLTREFAETAKKETSNEKIKLGLELKDDYIEEIVKRIGFSTPMSLGNPIAVLSPPHALNITSWIKFEEAWDGLAKDGTIDHKGLTISTIKKEVREKVIEAVRDQITSGKARLATQTIVLDLSNFGMLPREFTADLAREIDSVYKSILDTYVSLGRQPNMDWDTFNGTTNNSEAKNEAVKTLETEAAKKKSDYQAIVRTMILKGDVNYVDSTTNPPKLQTDLSIDAALNKDLPGLTMAGKALYLYSINPTTFPIIDRGDVFDLFQYANKVFTEIQETNKTAAAEFSAESGVDQIKYLEDSIDKNDQLSDSQKKLLKERMSRARDLYKMREQDISLKKLQLTIGQINNYKKLIFRVGPSALVAGFGVASLLIPGLAAVSGLGIPIAVSGGGLIARNLWEYHRKDASEFRERKRRLYEAEQGAVEAKLSLNSVGREMIIDQMKVRLKSQGITLTDAEFKAKFPTLFDIPFESMNRMASTIVRNYANSNTSPNSRLNLAS